MNLHYINCLSKLTSHDKKRGLTQLTGFGNFTEILSSYSLCDSDTPFILNS